MVLLLLLMMWTMWYLGGLERCRNPTNIRYFQDDDSPLMDMYGEQTNKRNLLTNLPTY
jgi:hypothetical protein